MMEGGVEKQKAKAKKKAPAKGLPSDKEMREIVLANSWSVYKKAAEVVKAKGAVMKTKSGHEQERPEYRVMNQMLEKILELKPDFYGSGDKKPKGNNNTKHQEDESDFDLD